MKYYYSYMTQQNISQEAHHKLLELEAPKRPPSGAWTKYGALAACAVLIAGVAVWRMSPSFVPAPVQSGSQTVLDNTSLPAAPPLPQNPACWATGRPALWSPIPEPKGSWPSPCSPASSIQTAPTALT